MKKIRGYYNNQINKMGKKQKITFYTASVILALLVVLCIGGLAYAWFSATVTGNENAQSNVVETGTLSIVYTNGQEIRGESIEPGWSETKTFTVENTGTVQATYNINWETLTNTFVNKQDLVLTLTSDNNGGNLEEEQISSSGNHVNILSDITIEPGVTQTYTMTITYKNMNYDQSSDMGKQLLGKIEVSDANEEIVLPKMMSGIKLIDKVHYPQVFPDQNLSVKKIIIENSINTDKSDELNAGEMQATPIDISENQDGSVFLISVYNIDNESEIIYLQGEGGIKLNENSSYLFSGLYTVESIEGLEYLDTSEVKDMSYMFSNLGVGIGNKIVLDLTTFNVENVEDTSFMFYQAGLNFGFEINMSDLNFSTLKNASGMFCNAGGNHSFKLYAENLKMPNATNMNSMFASSGGSDFEKSEIIGDFILPENADLRDLAIDREALKATFVLPNVISNYDNMFKGTATNSSFDPEITLVTNENNLALANELISLYGPNGTISKGNLKIK